MENKSKYHRYQRQILLKEFGVVAQEKLLKAKVLVIGAGGLGCPTLQYLAAAGVGTIGIVDFDVVEISNLQRQILFSVEDIGKPKAKVAAEKLKAFNPEILIQTFNTKLQGDNALKIISDYDVVIDGSDNFPTRYLVSDACVLLNKPLVYGSVFRFEGQVSVFNFGEDKARTNYRDMFPVTPSPDEVQDCNEAGVIGTLPGIIGTMQANETIKIITGIGKALSNKLLTYGALENSFYEVEVFPREKSNLHLPKSKEEFLSTNYEWLCNRDAAEVKEISTEEFERMLDENNILVIDVRNDGELPELIDISHLKIPLHRLKENIPLIEEHMKVVVFCQSGIRSVKAAGLIFEATQHENIFNLKGGIIAWKKHQDRNMVPA
ncbi:MAG TPA: HesA/MoeB/ThiF family protein [Bacteroidia bacterium]|nr:HesA/MoeB/ThiF family protein [Bacteroidia bacterium]